MASPSMTENTVGNLLTSQTLTASGTVTFAVNLTSKFFGDVDITATFGTIAATAGVQVDAFKGFGAGPTYDTNACTTFVLPAVAGARQQSLRLPTGRYQVELTNLDGTNSVTAVTATSSTLDSIA